MSNYDTMFELLFEQIKNLSEEMEELREEVDSFTKVLKPRRVKKSKEVPGQLSLFDYMDGGKTR